MLSDVTLTVTVIVVFQLLKTVTVLQTETD